MATCPSCNSPISDTANFCKYCGKPVREARRPQDAGKVYSLEEWKMQRDKELTKVQEARREVMEREIKERAAKIDAFQQEAISEVLKEVEKKEKQKKTLQ
jgi:predicted amidophosphoribosyltransferase